MEKNLYLLLLFVLTIATSCEKDDAIQPIDNYWQTDTPTTHGLDEANLQTAIDNARKSSNIYALLVIRNNKLLVEEYFNERHVNDLLHLRSITKTFTSALAGKAIAEGTITDADSPVAPAFPDFTLEGEKEQITLRHLLNMTSGLEWSENNEILPLINHQISNPISTIFNRPLATAPGTTFNYNSLSTHIVSQVLAHYSDTNFEVYAEEELLNPLGIAQYAWEKDTENRVWGGFGLQLTARDLAKFGQLYLDKGKWEGKQLIPADWVASSLSPQVGVTNATDYALHWWMNDTYVYGYGYGGQSLILVPDKQLLVVGLQGHLVSAQQEKEQWQFFSEEVLRPILNALE